MKEKNKFQIEENRTLFSPYITIFYDDDNSIYLFFTYFNLYLKGLVVYFTKDFNFLILLLITSFILLFLILYKYQIFNKNVPIYNIKKISIF